MKKSAAISVVIPVHNRSKELHRAIQSAMAQTHLPLEILVMDDASTEDLSAVVNSFHSPIVRLIRKHEKTNANVMRNLGILEAKGDYIALLDSDDEYLPDHLEIKSQELIDSTADGIFGSSFIDDGNIRTYAASRELQKGQLPIEYLLTFGFAPTPSWIVSREKASQVMFDETLHRHQDYEFFVQFAKKFHWRASWKPTIIIHWKAGESRKRHPGSEIQFIQRHFKEISPRVYFNYHLIQLGMYLTNDAPPEIISYYRKECRRYISQISFIDYCTMYPGRKGLFGFLMNWLSLSLLILIRKFVRPGAPDAPASILS